MKNKDKNLDNLKEKLVAFAELEKLERVEINLKDLNITKEDEHITISFNREDIEMIRDGNSEFLLVEGRRC